MRTRTHNRRKKTTRKRRSSRRIPIWMGLTILSFVIIVSAGGYLAQISAISAKGYAIRVLQNEINDLKSESEVLEFEVARERSMVAVEEKVLSMGMIPVSEIEYMTTNDPLVAKR